MYMYVQCDETDWTARHGVLLVAKVYITDRLIKLVGTADS